MSQSPAQESPNIDEHGLIGMAQPPGYVDEEGRRHPAGLVDGGDTCHFMGQYHHCLGIALRSQPRKQLPTQPVASLARTHDLLTSPTFFGGYKRHPDTQHWYGDDNRMSRDQWTPMLCALALWGFRKQLRAQLWSYTKRAFIFTTNTRKNGSTASNDKQEYAPGKVRDYSWKAPDLALFDIWAIFARGLGAWYLYPILLLADLQTLINAIIILKNPEDDDVLNFWAKHSLSMHKLPTPFAYITHKLIPRLKLQERVRHRYDMPYFPKFVGDIAIASINAELENS